MSSIENSTRQFRFCVSTFALNMVFGSFAACSSRAAAQTQTPSESTPSFKTMPDGKQWTTRNLDVHTDASYCYADAQANCRRYGRLYTWQSAQQECQLLGPGWRLPSNDEWRQMAKGYGGIRDDSEEGSKASYKALIIGGNSGLDAVLGGGRSLDGQYSRLEAHGFYWTASENDSETAWFYNFGKGSLFLNRHNDGEKLRAFSVRCIRN